MTPLLLVEMFNPLKCSSDRALIHAHPPLYEIRSECPAACGGDE